MAKLTTRSLASDGSTVSTDNFNKGTALTHSEMDSNFLNLNNNKLEITGPQTFTGNLTLAGSSSSAVGSVILNETSANGTHTVTLKAPDSITSSYNFTLPVADGTSNQVLATDGSGQLVFQSIAGDITKITINAGTGLSGTQVTESGDHTQTLTIDTSITADLSTSQVLTNKTLTSPVLNTGVSGTAVKDEDNMSSNSATHLATQQSIKAYVDAQVATKDALGELSGDSDDVGEGSTNLYFTNARADARISAASINDLSDVTTTGVSNGQVLAYNSTSGNFEPAADTTLSLIDEDSFATDSATRPPSQQSVKAYIATQIATKDNSDEITEGSSNLYFTNARADSRFDTKLAAADTDNLSEGSSNLYHTTARARAAISASGSLAYNSSTGALTYTQGAIDADSVTVSNLEVDNFKAATIVTESEGIGSNDNDTTLPTSAAVKDYVDNNAGGSTTLAGLTDTTISSVGDNEVLAYDNSSSKFINQTPSEANLVDISGTQTISGDKTYSGTNHFDGTVEIDDKLRIKDDEYLYFGDDDDISMRYRGSKGRLEIRASDANDPDKAEIRIKTDNLLDLWAGNDQNTKGDLRLTAYDDFQFMKGSQFTQLGSDVTATGSSGSRTITLGADLSAAQQILHNDAGELYFKHSSGTGGEARLVDSFNNNGSSTTITLDSDEDALDATMSGVSAQLGRKGRNAKVIVETSDRVNSSDLQFILQNRIGQEKAQGNQLIWESLEYNDDLEAFSHIPGSNSNQINRPVKYTLETKADKNSLTLSHQRTALDTDTDTEIFKITNQSTENSTVASPTSPDTMAMNVDLDMTTKKITVNNIQSDVNSDLQIDPLGTGDVTLTPSLPTGNTGPGYSFGWNDHSGFSGSGATGGAAHINSVLSVAAGETNPRIEKLYNEGIQISSTSKGDGSGADFSWPSLVFCARDKEGTLTSPNTNRDSNDQGYGNVWFVKENRDSTNTTQQAVESNQILGGFFGAGSKDSSSLAPTSAKMFMRATEDFSGSANGTRMEFAATANGNTSPTQCLDINGDSVVINEDSNDVDFRVESNSEANALKVDAGTDTVSIETIKLMLPNLPTSDPGVTGQVWNDSGTLKIS